MPTKCRQMGDKKPARRNITVNTPVYDRVYKIFEKEKGKNKISFTQWATDKFLLLVEKNDFLQSYAPHINLISIDDNYAVLKDSKLNKIIEVTYRNGSFFCSHDEKDCCIHVHYTLTLPESAKLRQ